MLEILKAILFGIVEGITEWLPISSTGHMILLDEFIHLDVSEAFYDVFEVVIQLGAIMAVVLLFWKQIWPFRKKETKIEIDKDIFVMWIKIVIACVPAAIVGIAFDDVLNALFYNPVCVALALILFGVAFIVIERWNKGKKAKITTVAQISYMTALLIGIFQLLAAIFPGTSRSGATIVGALLLGVSRTVAAEFTFFLAIPVMFGASLLKILKFILAGSVVTSMEMILLLTGMVVAFIVSVLVIRFLMAYIKKNDFTFFGWYRIALGFIVLLYFALV